MTKTANTAKGLKRKAADIYFAQKRRARLAGVTLTYTLEELRELIEKCVAAGYCVYCRGPLRGDNLSVDHEQPLIRNGGWELDNLTPCCRACNLAKGPLSRAEFCGLLDALRDFPDVARTNVLARLKAGAKAIRR